MSSRNLHRDRFLPEISLLEPELRMKSINECRTISCKTKYSGQISTLDLKWANSHTP